MSVKESALGQRLWCNGWTDSPDGVITCWQEVKRRRWDLVRGSGSLGTGPWPLYLEPGPLSFPILCLLCIIYKMGDFTTSLCSHDACLTGAQHVETKSLWKLPGELLEGGLPKSLLGRNLAVLDIRWCYFPT